MTPTRQADAVRALIAEMREYSAKERAVAGSLLSQTAAALTESWADKLDQALAAASAPPLSPDTYPWGETMPQYAVLGVGAEAWVELQETEKRGTAQQHTSAVLSWRTFKTVMNVLRDIRLKDFKASPASPPNESRSPDGDGQGQVAFTAKSLGVCASPASPTTPQNAESRLAGDSLSQQTPSAVAGSEPADSHPLPASPPRAWQPDVVDAVEWAEKKLSALVTEDDGNGAFIRGSGVELAGFGAGMKRLRSVIQKMKALPTPPAQEEAL